MAKSKGNQFTLRDLLARAHQADAIRYLLLSVHYRKQLNFTWDGLAQAQASITRLRDFVRRMEEKADTTPPCAEFARAVEEARGKFVEAMDDDMNTSAALGVLFDFIRSAYRAHDAAGLGGGDARAALEFVGEIDQVLGVVRKEEQAPDEAVLRLIEARQEARRRRDFAEADRIRALLQSRGIQVEDTRDGIRWKRVE
jgi:cysteinyl-tRNA synthetase